MVLPKAADAGETIKAYGQGHFLKRYFC